MAIIKLALDINALRELFPEGSQAQLDLRNAVIQNALGQKIRVELNQEITQCIHKEIQSLNLPNLEERTRIQLEEYFERHYGALKLTSGHTKSLREKIANFVEEDAKSQLQQIIYDTLSKVRADMLEKAVKAVDTRWKHWEETARVAAVKMVDTEMQDILADAMQAKVDEMRNKKE